MSPDAFDDLAAVATDPPAPDPAFVARLRARLEAELRPDSPAAAVPTTTAAAAHVPAGEAALAAYVTTTDTRAALAWYQEVLGAEPDAQAPIVMDDGRIGHAQLRFGGTLLMLSDAYPEMGVLAPDDPAGTTYALSVYVPDCDATMAAAAEAGATVLRPPADTPYGHRGGVIRDPFGIRWMVNTADAAATRADARGLDDALPTIDLGARAGAEPGTGPDEHELEGVGLPGDVGHWSLGIPDLDRATAFYGAVLAWEFEPGSVDDARGVVGVSPGGGLWGRLEEYGPGITVCWQVADADAATALVRSRGGTAEAPEDRPYGRLAECRDPEGNAFQVWQPPPGAPLDPGYRRPESGEARPGDVVFTTVVVEDLATALDFYGPVLGWTLEPAGADRLRVVGATPRTVVEARPGSPVHAEHAFQVADLDAALARVEAAGGTAGPPSPGPHGGRVAACTDDQGSPFALWQP